MVLISVCFFFSSRRRHTRCALVTGVQTCALPIFEALGYPDARFPDPASWLVDEERRAAFDGRRGQHFESRYHLPLLYLPPADQVARAERALMERDPPEAGRDWRQELTGFVAEADRVLHLLSGFLPAVRGLKRQE